MTSPSDSKGNSLLTYCRAVVMVFGFVHLSSPFLGQRGKAEEFRNQHQGFAASTTSTLPHFKIKHFFKELVVDMVG
jgi:hypothetical protein